MPSRYYQRIFIKGYYYHIYNRGANKEIVFKDPEDYRVFIDILAYYLRFPSGKPLSILKNLNKNESKKDLPEKVPNLKETSETSLKLCAYCLIPNHFHLLIKQQKEATKENSISNLMRRLTITFAMYAKKKYERSGTLFEGKFKNILVTSDAQLLQLSKYIHRNPMEIRGSEPLEYECSSYKYYIGENNAPDWLNIMPILDFFSKSDPKKSYQQFVEEIPKQIESEIIKNVTLE